MEVWPFARAGVPSPHNRRSTVAAGADDRLSALILRSFFHSFAPRRPALVGHARAAARSLRLVRGRAVRARSRVVDHSTYASGSHESRTQTTIPRANLERPADPDVTGDEIVDLRRSAAARARDRRGSDPLPPLRAPDRGQRVDHGRGPAVGRRSGPRRARPMARQRTRRRRGERPVGG